VAKSGKQIQWSVSNNLGATWILLMFHVHSPDSATIFLTGSNLNY